MKKVLVLLLALTLTFSMSFSVFAAPDKAKDNGKGSEKSIAVSEKSNLQKQFKMELNEQKKEIAKQKSSLEEEKLLLEAQYQELLDLGDTEGAEAVLVSISDFDAQTATLQAEMKKIINERYMVIKTTYSEEELQQFDSAAALIEQMYADADVLGAGSVTVKNNLIKFEAPPYIKGGKTLVPIRAITEGLGAEVIWDEETQSVSISKDGIVVIITINSCAVSVDSVPLEMDTPAEITCGRTYVPLRFLAETFGLEVNWDDENEIIDIEDGTTEDSDDGSIDDGITDDIDDGTTEDITTTDVI